MSSARNPVVQDEDPTAIPIEFDPTRQRMVGTAVHGNTPFDVPYVTPITDDLWTGGCTNGLILPPEVDHVVSLYPWESYRSTRRLKSTMAVKLYDADDEPDRNLIYGLAEWVNACRRDGVTLVHCQAGLNRSALVAGLALVLSGDAAVGGDAIAMLRDARSPAVLCNPAFTRWLSEAPHA